MPSASAQQTWEKLDRKIKPSIHQLNVAIKMRIKGGLWAHLSDLSPKFRFPVFSLSTEDKGYRVVGFGTAFPVKTNQIDKTFFLTSGHVVDTADPLIKEAERFYAAMRLYAEHTAAGKDVDARLKEVLQIVNLSVKKELNPQERTLYQSTVDGIWDKYEAHLSMRADPGRGLFKKYSAMMQFEPEVGYFLHAPGPITQAALEAKLYKVARNKNDPDLAILQVPKAMPTIELDAFTPSEGQEIQVIGYPTASDQIDLDSNKYYAPTFNTGRVSRVAPRMLQVDAPITKGDSGAPVVNLRGKVVGVVAVRAMSPQGHELPNYGGAVTIPSVQAFAPELFGKLSSR